MEQLSQSFVNISIAIIWIGICFMSFGSWILFKQIYSTSRKLKIVMKQESQEVKLLNFYEATFLMRHRFAISVVGVEGYFRFINGMIEEVDRFNQNVFKVSAGTLTHFDNKGNVMPMIDSYLMDGFLNLPRNLQQKRYYLANVDIPEPSKDLSVDCRFGKYCRFDLNPCKDSCK